MTSFVVMVVLGGVAFMALKGWADFSQESYQLEDTRGWLGERMARELEGGMGGQPVRVERVLMTGSGEDARVTRFELATKIGIGMELHEMMPGRSAGHAPWIAELGELGSMRFKGDEFAILSTMTQRMMSALGAAVSDGMWTVVVTGRENGLTFVWKDSAGLKREALEPRIGVLLKAATDCVEEARGAPEPEVVLRERARSRAEVLRVRWRAARALLQASLRSEPAARLLGELDELHEFVQAACVVWGGDQVELSPRARYAVLRRAEASAEAELADAARGHIVSELAWTCLTDAKSSNAMRRSVAARALKAPDAPPPGSTRDAALVGVLCDPAVPDLERGELFTLLMGQGWGPNARSRLEVAQEAGRWLREAMIKEVAARGVVFEDRDALLALRKGGVHDALAPLLDDLRRAGHLGAGQLTLAVESEHKGGLSLASQRGELTPAGAPAAGRGDMTASEETREDVVEVEE